MKARVLITPKQGVLDPQGVAVKQAMSHLGLEEASEVRVGKVVEIELKQNGEPSAHLEERMHRICPRSPFQPRH